MTEQKRFDMKMFIVRNELSVHVWLQLGALEVSHRACVLFDQKYYHN